MKKLLFLFIITSSLHSFAQNANWGTGLSITVTVNSSSLDLSVFDPILNQTKATVLSVGNNPTYKNNDGVVVGYGSYGNMYYATYDIELHAWKTSGVQISNSNSIGTILTSDGVVVGCGNIGNMNYATYDIELHDWKPSGIQISNSNLAGTVLTSDGVVVGCGNIGNMNYATYDIELHAWKTSGVQISNSNSIGTILTSDGVVVGCGNIGNMNYATYDIELHAWKTSGVQISNSNSIGTILTSDGMVVGFGDIGNMNYAIYDFNLDSWKTGGLQLGISGNISLSGGTITYSGSSSGIRGYNPNTQNWGSYSTTPACKFLPVVSTSSPWIFMRCMSMGASSFTYNCGDGHQISRKQGWKKYNINNTYNANLNVSNGVNNSTCNEIINIAIGISEYNSSDFKVYPNPANPNSNLTITSEEKIAEIKIYNIVGKCLLSEYAANERNKNINLNSTVLSKGMYFVEITTENNKKGIQKIIIQ